MPWFEQMPKSNHACRPGQSHHPRDVQAPAPIGSPTDSLSTSFRGAPESLLPSLQVVFLLLNTNNDLRKKDGAGCRLRTVKQPQPTRDQAEHQAMWTAKHLGLTKGQVFGTHQESSIWDSPRVKYLGHTKSKAPAWQVVKP